jgi:hypothetical protein
MNEFMLANLKELEFARRKNLGLVYGEQRRICTSIMENYRVWLTGKVDDDYQHWRSA